MLVVVAHLWPSALPGGYVGVDVFFAISGFLITSLLLREIERTGGLSLSDFWARRARRILPAALVTLLFCAIATILFVPLTYWQQFLAELRASTAYVQNWQLADSAVDYFAADNGPSPVQHFWSLSAEEQFYVVWPVLLLLAVGLTRGRTARVRRNAIIAVIGTLTAVSLAYSLYDTAANPSAAYFITPTRAWEFGLGGLLAMLPHVERSPGVKYGVLSWVGLAAIAAAAVFYTERTPFPGYAALLPVLGALAVIAAGAPSRRWAPTRVLELPPVQYVGDVSYSVYLWHWPLLIFAPFVIDRRLDAVGGVAILALTLIAAALSKRLVEDPVRAGTFLVARRQRWTFLAAAAGTAVVLGAAAGATSHLRAQAEAAERASKETLSAAPDCFGARARDPDRPCSNPQLRLTVAPTPIEAREPGPHCRLSFRLAGKQVCEFGVSRAEAKETVALIGDSHAGHWRASFDSVARANHARGLHFGHQGCPLSTATRNLLEPERSSCTRWKRQLFEWLRGHPEVNTVFVAQLSGGSGVVAAGDRSQFATAVDGYAGAWRALPASVRRIVVIRDTPKVRGDTDACVSEAMDARRPAGRACAVRRRTALEPDPAAVAAARDRSGRVRTVDLTRFFCDRRHCYPVIGGALVFKDPTHLTHVYAQTLAPYLRRAIGAAIARPVVAHATTGQPRCFGAAARDPLQPCRNPRLRSLVRPTPRQALRPYDHCKVLFHLVDKQVCGVGVAPEQATRTVALIGDSHAGHLRPAFTALTRAKRWRGITLGHASCPLSKATRNLPEPNRSHCVRWKRGLFRWFRSHPEVSIVFVSQLSGGSGVAPRGGRSAFETAAQGYAAAWRALPASVERIVVLRDTPKVRGFTDECVERAIAAHRRAGLACAVPRAGALDPDPAFTAARRSGSRRVHAVDLTSIFCDRRRCYPVVGGALAFKDSTHLTGVFAATLGPVLLRRVGG